MSGNNGNFAHSGNSGNSGNSALESYPKRPNSYLLLPAVTHQWGAILPTFLSGRAQKCYRVTAVTRVGGIAQSVTARASSGNTWELPKRAESLPLDALWGGWR